MNTIEYLHYDGNVDHLTIYKSGEKIASNIDTGLAILSLNKKKEIVGIEFMGAHEHFHVPLEILNHIQSCKVDLRYNPQKKILIINVLLQFQKKESPIVCAYENFDLGTTAFSQSFASSAA